MSLALLLTAAVATVSPETAAHTAQRELAATLAAADSIDAVVARGRTITFNVELRELPVAVTVETSPSGEVLAVELTDREPGHRDPRARATGALSWLCDELADGASITSLVVQRDGTIAIETADQRSYLALAAARRDGNAAVRARWAAAWD